MRVWRLSVFCPRNEGQWEGEGLFPFPETVQEYGDVLHLVGIHVACALDFIKDVKREEVELYLMPEVVPPGTPLCSDADQTEKGWRFKVPMTWKTIYADGREVERNGR